MDEQRKTTPLHPWHVGRSASMACFGGYHMPLWYPAGAKAEHLAVLTAAGLFDTSHMALLSLHGRGARTLLQRCCCRDLERCLGKARGPLVPGRSVYTMFLDERGFVIDDAIVSQCADADYTVVVNASMGAAVAAHLAAHNREGARIVDWTDRLGKMDLQGPRAPRILARVLKEAERVFAGLVTFSFKGSFAPEALPAATPAQLSDGTPVLVSRTGYTGEVGFELFVDRAHTASLWEQLLAAGADDGLLPCGLAARDSLRAGAGLPLSHQDIGPWLFARNPWLFVLPMDGQGGFTKEFVGAAALVADGDHHHTLAFAGFDPRKVAAGEQSRVMDPDGRELGRVLTCATDMAIDRVDGRIVSLTTPSEHGRPADFTPRGLCCGFVRVSEPLPAGAIVHLAEGRRTLKVEIRDEIRPDRTARQSLTRFLP